MKITPKRAEVIRNRYMELLSLASQFVGHGSGDSEYVRFDDAGNIECYVNHSCHCHPEYWWEQEKTSKEFNEWLESRKEY